MRFMQNYMTNGMNNMKRLLLGMMLLASFCGCRNDEAGNAEYTLLLQPYNNFTQAEAEQLKHDLEENLVPIMEDAGKRLAIEVLPNDTLSKEFYYAPRGRYRADRIIRHLERMRKPSVYRMGLTHYDISATVHGVEDYGILGLSFRPGHSSVVSTFRVKDRRHNLWKVTAHEFLHAVGLPHCPNDDPACLMKDAKGHPCIERQKGLCPTCSSRLEARWQCLRKRCLYSQQ